MKHIIASLDLNLLAKKMIDEIKKQWVSPLLPPVVVFSDSKVEQWFKLRWISEKDSVLLNLKTTRLDEFLFDLYKDSGDKMLSSQLVRDVLIKKLSDASYINSLGNPEVYDYLFDKNEKNINSIHLYDFATQMASLFNEYETTRPEKLLDLFSKSEWQKKLYDDVFRKGNGIKLSEQNYLSLLQLKNKKQGKMKWNPEQAVFLFGFSGIGQLYRKLLSDFSEKNNLFVYIQAPASIKKTNSILSKWAALGSENLELWGGCNEELDYEAVEPLSEQNRNGEVPSLHAIQNAIAREAEFEKIKKCAIASPIYLLAAPSKVREIEAIHSKICALLKDKNTRLGDILVLAPNIQDYKVAIEQVFDQNDSEKSEFPYIPKVIADYSSEYSLVADALQILFGMLKKKYLCRSDLFALLHNSLVQHVRHFSAEDVRNWFSWVDEMHIYRDRGKGSDENPKIEDWENAKTRLLLSRITQNLVEANGSEYLPYETIDSASNDSLCKFIDAVDELEKWILNNSDSKDFTLEKIDEITVFLKNWLLLSKDPPENLKPEKFVFDSVLDEIKNIKAVAASSEGNEKSIDADCFSFSLIDSAQSTALHSSGIFSGGVTFANFKPNGILPAKYIFFIGVDSKTLPGTDSENVLDLRFADDAKREPGDDSIPKKNKNAFLCQLMAAGEGFFISFVNKNLQKDEEFYKSSLLALLFMSKEEKKEGGFEDESDPEIKLNIDEDRNWSELFTSREFRNKRLCEKRNKSESGQNRTNENNITTRKPNYPSRVSISQIKRFLSDPFIFNAENLFAKEDEDSENEKLEFEPLSFDNLTNSSIRKDYIQKSIESGKDLSEEFKQKLKNENLLPDGKFGDIAFQTLKKESDELKSSVQKIFTGKEIEFEKSVDCRIDGQKIYSADSKDAELNWNLTGQTAWHNQNFTDNNELITVELNSSQNPLGGYVSSLALIASQKEEKEFKVSLNVISLKNKPEQQSFEIKTSEAKKLLQDIYCAMYGNGQESEFRKCLPYSLLKDTLAKSDKDTERLSDLKAKLSGQNAPSEWKYFSKKDLFDPYKDIGYTKNNFTNEWPKAKEKMKGLIKFLEDKAEEK